MTIMITESARWQLRLTIQDLLRRQDPEAPLLAQRVRAILSNQVLVEDYLQPIAGIEELPHREIPIGSYHLFFRRAQDTLWLCGLWPPMYPE